jgi:hypothetical protein
LPEFLTLLTARGRPFEVRLVDRPPQTYASPEQPLGWLRQQLWTRPGSARDERLQTLLRERLEARDGRYAFGWAPAHIGIVTWRSRGARD